MQPCTRDGWTRPRSPRLPVTPALGRQPHHRPGAAPHGRSGRVRRRVEVALPVLEPGTAATRGPVLRLRPRRSARRHQRPRLAGSTRCCSSSTAGSSTADFSSPVRTRATPSSRRSVREDAPASDDGLGHGACDVARPVSSGRPGAPYPSTDANRRQRLIRRARPAVILRSPSVATAGPCTIHWVPSESARRRRQSPSSARRRTTYSWSSSADGVVERRLLRTPRAWPGRSSTARALASSAPLRIHRS